MHKSITDVIIAEREIKKIKCMRENGKLDKKEYKNRSCWIGTFISGKLCLRLRL